MCNRISTQLSITESIQFINLDLLVHCLNLHFNMASFCSWSHSCIVHCPLFKLALGLSDPRLAGPGLGLDLGLTWVGPGPGLNLGWTWTWA